MRGRPRRGRHGRPGQTQNRPVPPRAASGSTLAPAPGPRRKSVLVIEDNASVGGLLAALIREEGYRSLRAWDVREALRMARDRRPDLIVLDLSLQHGERLEPLHELRAKEETSKAPIVVVAANNVQLSLEDRGLVADMVSKPFDVDRLMNVFRRVLGEPEQEVPERVYDSHDTHLHSW